jgi:hypothetical protein
LVTDLKENASRNDCAGKASNNSTDRPTEIGWLVSSLLGESIRIWLLAVSMKAEESPLLEAFNDSKQIGLSLE